MMLDEFLTDAALAVVIAVTLVGLACWLYQAAAYRRDKARLEAANETAHRVIFHNPFDDDDALEHAEADAFHEECGDR